MSPMQQILGWLLGAGVTGPYIPNLTAETITSMPNNSLFDRWRPYSHFLAPAGFMNDPCGPMYDPVGDLYHWHYQWHPQHLAWGNCSWGHAVSRDMITWTDVDHRPGSGLAAWEGHEAVSIGATNLSSPHHDPPLHEKLGVMSGSAVSANITGEVDGTLLLFYTGVSILPTRWDLPYSPGTESQSMAYSYDGGVTWERYEGNPILSTPPGNWNITSWRDPAIHPWPLMDEILNQPEPHYYAVFGSGIKDVGPRMPFYSAPASDLTNWTFLGSLWEPELGTTFGGLYETGTYGANFELSNFYSIDDHFYVNMGIEGGSVDFHPQKWSLWNEGIISVRANGSIAFEPVAGGSTDWGNLYAVASFNDSKNDRRVYLGWSDEDMGEFAVHQQGFAGAMSLPREIFVKDTFGVDPDLLTRDANSRYFQDSEGMWHASTLGIRPCQDVLEGLRRDSVFTAYNTEKINRASTPFLLTSKSSRSYQVKVIIGNTNGPTGLTIAASPDKEEYTSIYYDPLINTVVVNRTFSSLITQFNNRSNVAYFKPYMMEARDRAPPVHEPIIIDVILDGSLLELHINDRFALTTRIYPSRADSQGISLWSAGGVETSYYAVMVWDGLGNAWPERPMNTSTRLVYDTPEETNNYTWWPGY